MSANLENLNAQYDPLVKEDKFWIYKSYWHNDTPNVASGFLINFKGDTTINNYVYKKVFQQELSGSHPCSLEDRPCFTFDVPYKITAKQLIGFIREDTNDKMVYYKPNGGSYCNEDVYLLFDFSLKIDDKLDDCKTEALGDQPNFGIIDSIKNLSLFGSNRKVFQTTGYLSYIGLLVEGDVLIAEGVGFEKFGLFHHQNNLNELHDFCEGAILDCNIKTQLNEIQEKYNLTIYPNPSSNTIYIDTQLSIKSVIILNFSGDKTFVVNHHNNIDISHLKNGIYFVQMVTTDGQIYTQKIIKTN